MSWFGDVLSFEGFHGKDLLKNIWEHPQRLLTGVDPISTKISNTVLGRNDKPLVDQMGGATGDDYRKAEAAGINTSAGKGMQNLAHVVAAIEAGGYGMDSLGGLGGGAAGAGEGVGASGAAGGSGGLFGGMGEVGGTSSGMGLGGGGLDALTAGGSGGGAADFSLGSLSGNSANGAYSMGGGGSAGTNWGKLLQSGIKGAGQNSGGSNDAAVRQQQQLADMLRRNYEAQQQASQQLPGWINVSGG